MICAAAVRGRSTPREDGVAVHQSVEQLQQLLHVRRRQRRKAQIEGGGGGGEEVEKGSRNEVPLVATRQRLVPQRRQQRAPHARRLRGGG